MAAADRALSRSGVEVGRGRFVPWSELTFRTARSGGPGGQHANKVETQVELHWDLEESSAFSTVEKTRLRQALTSRLVRGRVLRLRARAARSQWGNRRAVVERFQGLLAAALRPRKRREKTAPTPTSKEARLSAKRHQGRRKSERRRPTPDD